MYVQRLHHINIARGCKIMNEMVWTCTIVRTYSHEQKLLTFTKQVLNMTEDFSPKALVIVQRLLELLG